MPQDFIARSSAVTCDGTCALEAVHRDARHLAKRPRTDFFCRLRETSKGIQVVTCDDRGRRTRGLDQVTVAVIDNMKEIESLSCRSYDARILDQPVDQSIEIVQRALTTAA